MSFKDDFREAWQSMKRDFLGDRDDDSAPTQNNAEAWQPPPGYPPLPQMPEQQPYQQQFQQPIQPIQQPIQPLMQQPIQPLIQQQPIQPPSNLGANPFNNTIPPQADLNVPFYDPTTAAQVPPLGSVEDVFSEPPQTNDGFDSFAQTSNIVDDGYADEGEIPPSVTMPFSSYDAQDEVQPPSDPSSFDSEIFSSEVFPRAVSPIEMSRDGSDDRFSGITSGGDRREVFDDFGSTTASELYSDDKTVISRNTIIRGMLQTADAIRLLGQIHGDIDCKSNIVVAGKVRGNTTAANAYIFDAQVDGDVRCDDVINVSNDAWVLGNIRAQQADIDGKIKGNIETRNTVSIGANSSILGDISTDEIEIKRGAFVNGQIMMYSPSSREVMDRFDRLGESR